MSKIYRGTEEERLFYLHAHDILCSRGKNTCSVSNSGRANGYQRDTGPRSLKSTDTTASQHNEECFFFQKVVSRRTGTECSCRAEMDMMFCSMSCPYATNAPMSKDPVMTGTYGKWCG